MTKKSTSSKGRGSTTSGSRSIKRIAAISKRLDRLSEKIERNRVNVRTILSWIDSAGEVETDTSADAED